MILNAMKSAILRVSGVVADEVFTSSSQIAVEMADLVNDVATEIMRSHDWRALTRVANIAAGGESHPLPDDYDRMVLGATVDDQASWFWGYEPFDSVNDWMRYKSGSYNIQSPGGWIIIGGGLQFYPATNAAAQFPYISNLYARDEDGDPKPEFTSDNDTFVLDDRLLTLGLIWRWLDMKDMPYAEAMETYERALAQSQARDGGSRVLRTPMRYRMGGNVAYVNRAIP